MASVAEGISLNKDFTAMGLVTVSAAHTCQEHFTLKIRTVNIDLFVDLAVGIIKVFFQDARRMGI
jgi:hypothetical protein